MIIFLILVVAVVLLDIAAFRWGCDSRDEIDSPEWEKWHHAVLHMHQLPHTPFELSRKVHMTARERY
jgi:hypothetical protein